MKCPKCGETTPDYSTLSEADYKAQCAPLSVYEIRDNAENYKNKLVTIRGKVLQYAVNRSTQEEYLDFGVESVTDSGMYSYVSTPVYLKDCRDDKSITTNDGDVFTAYGVATIAYDYYYGHYTMYVNVKYIE